MEGESQIVSLELGDVTTTEVPTEATIEVPTEQPQTSHHRKKQNTAQEPTVQESA